MTELEQAIISTLVYYDLLNRPLTGLELFKFLIRPTPLECSTGLTGQTVEFNHFLTQLEQSQVIKSLVQKYQGHYFLKEREPQKLFTLRQKRIKISQVKWRKTKKAVKILQVVPFIQMIGITGSLSIDNAKEESDLDFFIALAPNRLWIGRTFVTLVLSLFGRRRHHNKIKDRACLNCYLADPNLAIGPEIKTYNLYSAQEYGQLISVWQTNKSTITKFNEANLWIKNFLQNYPWPNQINLKTAKPSRCLAIIKKFLEWLLGNKMGDWLEKRLAAWQTKRIERKINKESSTDHIYCSDYCLMFHPQAKGPEIFSRYEAKLKKLLI